MCDLSDVLGRLGESPLQIGDESVPPFVNRMIRQSFRLGRDCVCGLTNRTHCHGNKSGVGMNALCPNLKNSASFNFVFPAFFRIVWTMMADLPDFQEQEAA